jgi:serine/threonine protein kinase
LVYPEKYFFEFKSIIQLVNNGVPFKITEVGDMGNLEEFIDAFGCTIEIGIRYLSQIGEAVSFLQIRRFIHRNLRASSVFIYSDGNVSKIDKFSF